MPVGNSRKIPAGQKDIKASVNKKGHYLIDTSTHTNIKGMRTGRSFSMPRRSDHRFIMHLVPAKAFRKASRAFCIDSRFRGVGVGPLWPGAPR